MYGAAGLLGIEVLLVVMGLLSRRLGRVTHAKPYYLGFYLSAAFVTVGVGVRLIHAIHSPHDLTHSVLWVLLYNGFPALGLTIAVIIAWRYWSWLLAERD